MKKKCEVLAAKLNLEIDIYKFSDWQGWEYAISLLDGSLIYEDGTTGRSGHGYDYKIDAWKDIWSDLNSLVGMKTTTEGEQK